MSIEHMMKFQKLKQPNLFIDAIKIIRILLKCILS